jgi:hypothetical protein
VSRPLTGRLVANPSGTFTASVPPTRGAKKRKEATFTTKAAAERWVRACVVALEAGKPLPRPGTARAVRATVLPPEGSAFKPIAEDFVQERYVEDGHGDVDREEQVRGYIKVIDEYMGWKRLTLQSITRKDARKMFKHFLKTPTAPKSGLPKGLDPETRVTKSRARHTATQCRTPHSSGRCGAVTS